MPKSCEGGRRWGEQLAVLDEVVSGKSVLGCNE